MSVNMWDYMYWIEKQGSKYLATCRIQDGRESSLQNSVEEAKIWIKDCDEIMNGGRKEIKDEDILILGENCKRNKHVFLGVVGVDSGSLLICDPCYLDNEWEQCSEEERCNSIEDFLVNTIPDENTSIGFKWRYKNNNHTFGIIGVFSQQMSIKRGGQLNYKSGHPGAGVALSPGWGDGVYGVYADYSDDGCIESITIDFVNIPQEK